jgi:plasmid stabilization system protein ParE
MALPVIWTENALEDYRKVVEYLLKNWPVDVAAKLIDTVESRLETLSVFPNLGIRSSKEEKIRAIVLTKHNKLYYQVTEEFIQILDNLIPGKIH